ncbi:hypothetical protein TEA_026603 [Camellia sinensis var. sinensis]|uniref:K Homology domain-containing protein n=1 Tax=Camellia sinensis var. sinensis TaxID=542762 RepID=A0A4S4D9V2_CAMSN|nr:hypothetical protein TEA_026603 [Camellia sinensis var. sinensis]
MPTVYGMRCGTVAGWRWVLVCNGGCDRPFDDSQLESAQQQPSGREHQPASGGAKIQITRDADADPYSATRPVELIGTSENINMAEKLIKDVIAEADAGGGSPSLVARGFGMVQAAGTVEQVLIQVPNEKVGVIIGKGGETIKNLQTRSGARIQLIPQHLPDGDQSKERTVRVAGDKKQIEMAREMIKEVMNQALNNSSVNNFPLLKNFNSVIRVLLIWWTMFFFYFHSQCYMNSFYFPIICVSTGYDKGFIAMIATLASRDVILGESSSVVDSKDQDVDGHVLAQYYGIHESAWVDLARDLSQFDNVSTVFLLLSRTIYNSCLTSSDLYHDMYCCSVIRDKFMIATISYF